MAFLPKASVVAAARQMVLEALLRLAEQPVAAARRQPRPFPIAAMSRQAKMVPTACLRNLLAAVVDPVQPRVVLSRSVDLAVLGAMAVELSSIILVSS